MLQTTPFRRAIDPVVITGIGMITSVGDDRESVWQAVCNGQRGVRALNGVRGIPDGLLIGAPVDYQVDQPGQLKSIALAKHAATEAIADSKIDLTNVDLTRFGCNISGHMGDTAYLLETHNRQDLQIPNATPWWGQLLPNTACSQIANDFGLLGPRVCHSTACASGLVDILSAVRAIQDDQCDIALAGSGESIDPIFAAGFRRMRVLASDDQPENACRPFDRNRKGFVMGEGAAMFVVERLSHALARGATIYAEVAASKMLAEAHHVTSLDTDSEALTYLVSQTISAAKLAPRDISYINAHGTGTELNDLVEMRGIRQAMGAATRDTCVSATKSMLGHLVAAAGSVELAITALALRDGFAPPTMNLTDPDPECHFDCLPMIGREDHFQHAMKISVAFGGHLVAMILSRWNETASGFAYPQRRIAA